MYRIVGVQGRYYTPILILGLLYFIKKDNNWKIKTVNEKLNTISFILNIFALYYVYILYIEGIIMEKIKKYLKRILKSDSLPYILFFVVLVLFHMGMKSFVGDDEEYFGNILFSGMSIPDYVKVRYIWWSSRIIIELFIIILANYQLVVWSFFDIAMYMLLAKSISKLALSQNNKFHKYFICIMLLLLPIPVLNSVGWICTSLNYLWIAAFAIFALSIIKDYIIGTNIPI